MKHLKEYHYAWLEKHPERTEEWLRARLADGFHIHHLDGNHSNNVQMNLILIEGLDHLALHGMITRPMRSKNEKKPKKKKISRKQLEKQLKNMTEYFNLLTNAGAS